MAIFNTYAGWFFDKQGNYLGMKGFSKNKEDFEFKSGRYMVDLSASYVEWSAFPIFTFLWRKWRYFYNVESSIPKKITPQSEPPISPALFDVMMETKLARDLNNLSKGGLSELLTPRNIIIGIIVLGVVIYLATGHSLLGGAPTPSQSNIGVVNAG